LRHKGRVSREVSKAPRNAAAKKLKGKGMG
jgi:hypothetical protein